MTLNTETLSALRSVDRLDAIVKHLKSMPLAHRAVHQICLPRARII